MNFSHPWILLLALAPIAWAVRTWKDSARKSALLLKTLSFIAVIVALAEPKLILPETKTAAVVLVDTSASISQDDLARASGIVQEMARQRGRNWMQVVPFARTTRDLTGAETNAWHLQPTAAEPAKGTDLETALREGMSVIPPGRIPRLVLISDGQENEGSTARAIAQLRRLHIPVDTIPLAGRPQPALRLVSVSLPHRAYADERIPIDITLESPSEQAATVTIQAEGKTLGENPVTLHQGTNSFRVHARVKSTGATAIAGKVSAPGLGEVDFEEAIQLRQGRILYISQDPQGTENNLLSTLKQAQFEVSTDRRLLNGELSDVQLVVLNNLDLNNFSDTEKNRLEEYVKSGGGLLLIGGERQVYKEDKQADALDRALPAKLAPPRSLEGTCIVLIIDKSSSMEGRKMELARISAIGAIDHLRPADLIGVLIFDNSYQWAVPIRRAEDKTLIKRLVSGITPDGGTQIAPALSEAYRKIVSSPATYKHIVLLTDGISEEGDSLDLAKEAAERQVTISTVGLGQDVNRSYLERVASLSHGNSYFLSEPQGLEQILLRDVMEHSGSTAVEKPLVPIVNKPAEILEGVGMDAAPPLKGYARFTTKSTAETLLSLDPVKKDPLFVRWQYGLGRAAVFSSDAKSRWAEDWMRWPGYEKFWVNVARDLLPHSDSSEATAQFDTANGDLVVNYRLGHGIEEPATVPQIFVLGRDSFEKPIEVKKVAPGIYHGRLHLGQRRGLFRIRPLEDSKIFPEVGLYRQQEELTNYGSNSSLLSQVASFTGGRFDPSPASVFQNDGRSLWTTWNLWPGFLGLAIALTIAELVMRKWRGILQRFRRA